ncbi:hypothetical protein [Segetibacter sp. 3557_3]|uniref:hypothetical protein n=1 Tax=Segetibacter sp. 3557_3 TaxID=2547429 RepID=UPI001A9D24B0|nr:hypothetical protein [Segetibacter sp. 3557_3]
MEATLVIKAKDLTPQYADGLMKIFSGDAVLNITVQYDSLNTSTSENLPNSTSTPGKKRGPKPKIAEPISEPAAPKKRGRKPKVAAE